MARAPSSTLLFVLIALVIAIATLTTRRTKRRLLRAPRMRAFQIYHDPDHVPAKVSEAWKKHASDFDRQVYSYEKARDFLRATYPPAVIAKFDAIPNLAHKADLFRMCILYTYGGLYADIKTELVTDLSASIRDPSKMYTCVSEIAPGTIYNGFMYSPAKNPILRDVIQDILRRDLKELETQYHANIKAMLQIVQGYLAKQGSVLRLGNNKTRDGAPDIVVFNEVSKPKSTCTDGTDRYGFCAFIVDARDRIVCKTRYADFPWDTTK